MRVKRSGGESTWARAGLNKGSAASNHVLTDHSGLINVMLAGGGRRSRSEDPFKTKTRPVLMLAPKKLAPTPQERRSARLTGFCRNQNFVLFVF